jgi:hypothetical protein
MENAEIQEEIQHQKAMIKHLRQQLRDLEIQEVKFGITVPTHILEGLRDTRTRLEEHQTELARLSTLAAEDQFSIKEAEYNVLLSEAWSLGPPNVVNSQRLEFLRLRLGISPQRATELALQIRKAIVEERLQRLEWVQVENFSRIWQFNDGPLASSISLLRDMVLIHPTQTAELFFRIVGHVNSPNGVNNIYQAILQSGAWPFTEADQSSYSRFFEELLQLNS